MKCHVQILRAFYLLKYVSLQGHFGIDMSGMNSTISAPRSEVLTMAVPKILAIYCSFYLLIA